MPPTDLQPGLRSIIVKSRPMRSHRIRCIVAAFFAALVLVSPGMSGATEAVYRLLPSASQQTTLARGMLSSEPAARFVAVLLLPASGRNAPYEHRFPTREAAPYPLPLNVRQPLATDEPDVQRKHPFEPLFDRILVYWGCGEEAGQGQPLVLKVDPDQDERLSRLLPLSPRRATTPIDVAARERWLAYQDVRWPDRAVMNGAHELAARSGSLKFEVDADGEFLPPVRITGVQAPAGGPLRVHWQDLPRASAYVANVFVQRRLSREVVIWTSSRRPEGGWLFYQTHPGTEEIERLRQSGVLLGPGTEQCSVPAAVRRHSPDAMVFQLHAYAPELVVRAQGTGDVPPTVVRVAPRSTASVLLHDLDAQRTARASAPR